MIVSMGSDARMPIMDALVKSIERRGHEVIWHGPASMADGFDSYPNIAEKVCADLVSGKADEAIVCCFTGTGITIAANKVKGIRAALCHDAFTAQGARLWNDANVLTLSMRLTPEILLEEILDAWFENKYEAGQDESIDSGIEGLKNLDK